MHISKKESGLEFVEMGGPNGSILECYLFGGHITKFITSSKVDVLFTSRKAKYDGKTSIRGGIPVIFPQFGNRGQLGRHGFARQLIWKLTNYAIGEEYTSITLELSESNILFPFNYNMCYTIKLFSEKLECEIK